MKASGETPSTSGIPPGDVTFTDGRAADGTPGTEALRLCGATGKILVRGVETDDPKAAVVALRDWVTRALEANQGPWVTDGPGPVGDVSGDQSITISAGGGYPSITLRTDGYVLINGEIADSDDELRHLIMKLIRRIRDDKRKTGLA